MADRGGRIMAFSSLALNNPNCTSMSTIWELVAPVGCSPAIIEIATINPTANQSEWGLGRPSVPCVGPTLYPFQMDNLDEQQTRVKAAVTYQASGGAPLVYRRRVMLTAGQGCAAILTYPRGLIVPEGTSMCIWPLVIPVASVAMIIHCVIED